MDFDFNDLLQNEQGEWDPFELDSCFPSEEENGADLPSFDYNLNSPLLRDDIDCLLTGLQGKGTSLRYYSKWNVNEAHRHLATIEPFWGNVNGSYSFHSWVAFLINMDHCDHDMLKEQWEWIEAALKQPAIVVNTFFRYLYQSDTIDLFKSISKSDIIRDCLMTRTKSEISLFGHFYYIVLFLNSGNIKIREKLIQELQYSIIRHKDTDVNNSFLVGLSMGSLGPVYITTGFVYLKKYQRLLNRNMVLMIKDLLAARSCSKLALYGIGSQEYYTCAISKLDLLYHEGDLIMQKADNYGFDFIKLLEGLCSFRFMELSRNYRPLIPPDTRFRDHLQKNIEEFESKWNLDCSSFTSIILSESNPLYLCNFYSVFRHWGHPFIDYLEGLETLYQEVNREIIVDTDYSDKLASDLAFKILSTEFHRQKKWFIDIGMLATSHPLYKHVLNNTWPTKKQISDLGDEWHRLPLKQCYEIPPGIDPSALYADKSHSMNRDEIITFIKLHPNEIIPSKKVLHTALTTPELNLPIFLREINDNGVKENSLVIGLKGKEREVKRIGRFFSLMSWELRMYFVVTEYLIKKFFVPLFSGLTMADDYNSVIKKMLDRATGQGESDYQYITFANHFDYSKWNNTQRGAANDPVFLVMGKFLGLPKLFVRTHEFFEKSWIYYNDRGDLISVQDDCLTNKTEKRVCWIGQKGGLEGLRQKGWSIVSLLMIERESKIRNTLIKVLAQGDNQVICSYYKLPKDQTHSACRSEIPHVIENNGYIVKAIIEGTGKLGLRINRDETLTSTDYLNYGKVVFFRGNMLPLAIKKWSRVTCTTNDQIPSLKNILGTISTNALGVTQHSPTISDGIINYTFFSLYCLGFLRHHNPLQGSSIPSLDPRKMLSSDFNKVIVDLLFLDPSLGGLCGTSLARFLIRQFPDPVTESLSFWKIIHDYCGNPELERMCIINGNPPLASPGKTQLVKLLENPMSLNIPKSLNPATILREAVRSQLTKSVAVIQNRLFQEAIVYLRDEEYNLIDFLLSVKPLFPRFLSEFRSGCFLGIVESLVNLFQNSRTMRLVFQKKFHKDIIGLLRSSESNCIARSIRTHLLSVGRIWCCSTEQADDLRYMSWGEDIVGTTIPHPLEMIKCVQFEKVECKFCQSPAHPLDVSYISVIYPHGFYRVVGQRGPLPPYLGSKTQETTSVFQPWEKEVEIPLIYRAMKLRNTIQWFVPQGSNLSKSIINNLNSLTGLNWSETDLVFERTGSAIHRFHSSRQSAGGFCSVSPNLICYTFVTSDTFGDLNSKNHDFMYQSLLLFAQLNSTMINLFQRSSRSHHFHIQCRHCVREIPDIKLESSIVYQPRLVKDSIETMSGCKIVWIRPLPSFNLPVGNWLELTTEEKCYHIGTAQGLLYSLFTCNFESHNLDQSLFPETITKYVRKEYYLLGILRGLLLGSCYISVFHRDVYSQKRPIRVTHGGLEYLIQRLLISPYFIPSVCRWDLERLSRNIPHRIPPSYPSNKFDLGSMIAAFWHHHIQVQTLRQKMFRDWNRHIWIFADFRTSRWIGLTICAFYLRFIYGKLILSSTQLQKIRVVKEIISYFLQSEHQVTTLDHLEPIHLNRIKRISQKVKSCHLELRLAAKELPLEAEKEDPFESRRSLWGQELMCSVRILELSFSLNPTTVKWILPRRICPLISGLRVAQLATGAHYKLRPLLGRISDLQDGLCGGDGSGGMTAAFLRYSPKSRAIFNSLMCPEDNSFMGLRPSPPAALTGMEKAIRKRCVNLFSCWAEPSDLRDPNTWENFLKLKREHLLCINLIILDMEVRDLCSFKRIIDLLINYQEQILEVHSYVLLKCYGSLLPEESYKLAVENLCSHYRSIEAGVTELSSGFTSEFYLILQDLLTTPTSSKYLSDLSLGELRAFVPASRSEIAEFNRALKIKNLEMCLGIPAHLIPDLEAELFSLLCHIGLETGISRAITENIKSEINESNCVAYEIAVLGLISNSLINTTGFYIEPFNYPSLTTLQIHYAAFVGIWLAISWQMEWFELYSNIQWWLTSPIYYGFTLSKTQHDLRLIWSWNRGAIKKHLHKPSKLSISAQMVRLLSRLSKHAYGVETLPSQIVLAHEEITGKYNKNLGIEKIFQSTGLLEPIHLAVEIILPRLHHNIPWNDHTYPAEDVEDLCVSSEFTDNHAWTC
ncbi:RNA-dependent RNA polymerase [Xingshan nematode virus 4]|uniref:Replicase n=1 Tax=Xingshan nematode virus 4 TaxID=1923763 RepID=A0A1L3KN93_9RHAB|nr:RNA-dependent RNA polymerase [Xingshan nematode virus 4]APG78847.1 RNA-dependent RNA polymerase [Xingshan nematode virus 4]